MGNIELFNKLKTLMQNPLPGMCAQEKMIPNFPDNTLKYFNYDKNLRDAAVLIVLFEEDTRLKTFFIERMPEPGPHSGQIAFPGGRVEKIDKDLFDTAIREAFEETGVKVKRENILGSLTPVEIPISGFSVLPVVAFYDTIPKFIPCEKEVKSVFTVDLFNLFESESIKNVSTRNIEVQAPCFISDDKIIWGATAMVLKEFKEMFKCS